MALKDDKRYAGLELVPGTYLPDAGIDYPQDDAMARLVPAPILKDIKFDDSYPYLDDSLSFRMGSALLYAMVFTGMSWLNNICYGVRYRGRDVLRKYRKELKGGLVSVCNHCYRYDGMAVAKLLRHRLWIPMLHEHFQGPNAWMLRHFGGIPLTDGTLSAQKKFNEAFDEIHRRGGWIHVFPEARNWHFYKPLRPFAKGAFTMAYKYNIPVLPINISYRERTGIYKLFGKAEEPLMTITVGEPIFPDVSQPRKNEVERLQLAAHAAVCELGGIIRNTWPAEAND